MAPKRWNRRTERGKLKNYIRSLIHHINTCFRLISESEEEIKDYIAKGYTAKRRGKMRIPHWPVAILITYRDQLDTVRHQLKALLDVANPAVTIVDFGQQLHEHRFEYLNPTEAAWAQKYIETESLRVGLNIDDEFWHTGRDMLMGSNRGLPESMTYYEVKKYYYDVDYYNYRPGGCTTDEESSNDDVPAATASSHHDPPPAPALLLSAPPGLPTQPEEEPAETLPAPKKPPPERPRTPPPVRLAWTPGDMSKGKPPPPTLGLASPPKPPPSKAPPACTARPPPLRSKSPPR